MKPSRLLVHTSLQPMRWGDMDALGHINNTVYFRYMEQARIEWLFAQAAGGGYGAGQGPVIVNASCNFLLPLVYPGDVEVRMYLSRPGRSSVASHYEILADAKTYADGAAKMVWIDLASGRPTPLPERIVAQLRQAA
ncbi:MAG: thioesterase family protein [Betaproteobacteria bacterium]